MNRLILTTLAAAVTAVAAPASAATYLVGANTTGTFIGNVTAGQAYRFRATGVVNLVGENIPGTFDVDADGVPTAPVTFPGYEYFGATGTTTLSDGTPAALATAKFGALIGTIDGGQSYFLIGRNSRITFAQNGQIFARINDINFNNSGSFQVNVEPVPEPATWAMMMLGFGMVGFGLRRRAGKVTTRIAFA